MTAPWKLIELPRTENQNGSVQDIISGRDIPFAIKRVYYLYDVPRDLMRAGHAHKELQQLMVAVTGSFRIHLDNGYSKETYILDKPWQGILLNSMVWREIDQFSDGCVCVVFASLPYNENDYYRDYDDFKSALTLIRH